VLAATGLSVLGLIPHIRKGRGRLALITQPLKTRSGRQPSPSPNGVGDVEPNPGSNRHFYTFLHGPESSDLVPLPQAPEGRVPALQLVVANPGSVEAEAYSILQTNLSFARVEHPVKSLVLTSPLPGDGKTTNAINLASTMAERGLRTLLVDADLRRGTVHAAMSFPREPGLTDVLAGSSTIAAVLRSVTVGRDRTLEVLTTGSLTHSPTPLLESQAMRSLMAELRQEYDFIVVDAPPVNIVTDAALLGALADGVLVVARAGTTDAAALSHAVQQLRHVRATILGVLLNDINFRRDASYDGAYRFYTYDQYRASSGLSS
jgi:capsular exopolysaccharide synthesis family protein